MKFQISFMVVPLLSYFLFIYPADREHEQCQDNRLNSEGHLETDSHKVLKVHGAENFKDQEFNDEVARQELEVQNSGFEIKDGSDSWVRGCCCTYYFDDDHSKVVGESPQTVAKLYDGDEYSEKGCECLGNANCDINGLKYGDANDVKAKTKWIREEYRYEKLVCTGTEPHALWKRIKCPGEAKAEEFTPIGRSCSTYTCTKPGFASIEPIPENIIGDLNDDKCCEGIKENKKCWIRGSTDGNMADLQKMDEQCDEDMICAKQRKLNSLGRKDLGCPRMYCCTKANCDIYRCSDETKFELKKDAARITGHDDATCCVEKAGLVE